MATGADDHERKKKKSEKKKKREKKKKEKKNKKVKKRKRCDSDGGSSSSSDSSSPPVAPIAPTAGPLQPAHLDFPMPRRRYTSSGAGGISAGNLDTFAMRDARSQRFTSTAADQALRNLRDTAPSASLPAGTHVKGESYALEKSYLRLTAMPRADEVRPLPVLHQAFALVQERWARERDYPYACEQLKAIRQDLTVQHLTGPHPRARFATLVYEAHARMALQSADLDEFAACQAQLIPLHAAGLSPHRAEFAAYRLLYGAARRLSSMSEELLGEASFLIWQV